VLNVLDVFSGIGGFSIGLEAVEMQTVAFCEINPFCRKILTRHWPSVPVFSDITTVHKEDLKTLPTIDVIAGGFPCQDISVVGKAGLTQNVLLERLCPIDCVNSHKL
jgi:DNA (cytosine-5)-methyltransferase 1